MPKEYALHQAYPNPFNPTATIEYEIPEDSPVTLKVFNILGQIIATLTDDLQSAGKKLVIWTANDVASGIYFYRFEATSITDHGRIFTQVKKMMLVK